MDIKKLIDYINNIDDDQNLKFIPEKEIYSSIGDANIAANILNSRVIFGTKIEAYPCFICQGYHIGHNWPLTINLDYICDQFMNSFDELDKKLGKKIGNS